MGPPKDFQGGPDACVHLTSEPVLSMCSNLHRRSANVMGCPTGRVTGRAKGCATGHVLEPEGRILGASPHFRTFILRVLNDRVLNAIQFFHSQKGSIFSCVRFYDIS